MKKTIYIFSNGEIKRKENTLVFANSDGIKKFFPIENVKEIHIFGEVSLNKKLLDFVSQNEIIIHYFNYYGYYSGSFYPREHYNSGYMILKQAEFYLNSDKRLELAKQFVIGYVKNALQNLNYYKDYTDLEEETEKINKLYGFIENQSNIKELMAIEGNIHEIYYRTFNKIIKNKNFYIDKREKRPPSNELNALISFMNSLVYTTVLSEIYKTHLDPRIGYLHTTNFRRFTLNLDVAEIFKPLFADRIIFRVLNKGMIKKKDFNEKLGGIYLKENGRKILVKEFDNTMQTTIKVRNISNRVSYRRLIRLELYKVEKHLIEEKKYEPYISRW